MITVTNLTKLYGEQRAVDNISFTVKKGEILGFLGPNGAGKTTTMRIITCFMLPTSGTVVVDDLDVQNRSLEVRQKIGYLPEHAPLYMDMNVVDYLRYVAELRNIPKEKQRERIQEMIEVCGLRVELHKTIDQLSKGYRQRVGLAQAMIHDPEILILDEPTLGLDPNQIVEIRQLIKRLGREKTVILCSHILSEVEATCGRVIIIHQGRLVADGTTENLQAEFQGKERLYIEFKTLPEDSVAKVRALDKVEDVRKVKSQGTGTQALQIESSRGDDVREAVFNLAVKEGWSIAEMHREVSSLEDVFRALTGGTPRPVSPQNN
jgi:ABC-2 type transport system ATP-binding protein